MDKHVIPPTPNRQDYTQKDEYQAQARANATPIDHIEDPFELLTTWLADARQSEINDSNAMSLATVDAQGNPDVRIVLLKEIRLQGVVFYSNQESQKGQQLSCHPYAALCLHWKSLRRQVRMRGRVILARDEDADAYFASRARGSQIGAWASDQSRICESRELLEERVHQVEAEYEGKAVPRPPHWKGWCLVPDSFEFWRDRPFRLHDRLSFLREDQDGNVTWNKSRLYP